jgi:uncharacterized protein YbjT (DUF2867 family)
MSQSTVLITGPRGNVGSSLIQELLAKGLEPAIADYKINQPGENQRLLDFTKPDTFGPALQGIKQIFLVRPPIISDVKKYFVPFLEACQEAKIEQIVFLSLQGAENNSVTPHHKIEKYIQKLNLPYTFLRPSFFMQNLTTTHLKEIQNGEIFIPAGQGKTSFIDVRDIGALAAKVLLEKEPHLGQAYEITGTEALSYYEVAEIISHKSGKKVEYKNPSPFAFYFRKRKEGLARGFVLVMIALYTVAKLGKADQTTPVFEKLMNRQPISFTQFVEDSLEAFAA